MDREGDLNIHRDMEGVDPRGWMCCPGSLSSLLLLLLWCTSVVVVVYAVVIATYFRAPRSVKTEKAVVSDWPDRNGKCVSCKNSCSSQLQVGGQLSSRIIRSTERQRPEDQRDTLLAREFQNKSRVEDQHIYTYPTQHLTWQYHFYSNHILKW